MTFIVYSEQPKFPATDQNPNCVRYQGDFVFPGSANPAHVWVDTDNPSPPTQTDIDAVYAPGIAEAARRAALKNNARALVLINALTTKDDVALNAAVAARYPGLANDALKAVQDIALILAYQYHNGG